jgi:hypothetical protein
MSINLLVLGATAAVRLGWREFWSDQNALAQVGASVQKRSREANIQK